MKSISLTDVCNHSYGTVCAPFNEKTGRRIIENRIILRKNTEQEFKEMEAVITKAADKLMRMI